MSGHPLLHALDSCCNAMHNCRAPMEKLMVWFNESVWNFNVFIEFAKRKFQLDSIKFVRTFSSSCLAKIAKIRIQIRQTVGQKVQATSKPHRKTGGPSHHVSSSASAISKAGLTWHVRVASEGQFVVSGTAADIRYIRLVRAIPRLVAKIARFYLRAVS